MIVSNTFSIGEENDSLPAPLIGLLSCLFHFYSPKEGLSEQVPAWTAMIVSIAIKQQEERNYLPGRISIAPPQPNPSLGYSSARFIGLLIRRTESYLIHIPFEQAKIVRIRTKYQDERDDLRPSPSWTWFAFIGLASRGPFCCRSGTLNSEKRLASLSTAGKQTITHEERTTSPRNHPKRQEVVQPPTRGLLIYIAPRGRGWF